MKTLLRIVFAITVVFGVFVAGTNAGAQTTRSLTVTPDTGLSDGDTVEVHGTGFTPSAIVYYCQAVVDASPSASDCGSSIETTNADTSGEFTVTFQVQRFITSGSYGDVDCAQAGANCGMGASDSAAPTPATVASAPLTFTPQPPVELEITGTVTGPGSIPLAGVNVWAYTTSDGYVGSHQTVTSTDGTYTLADLRAGEGYRVRFGPPSGSNLVPEWWDDVPNRDQSNTVTLSFSANPHEVLNAQLSEGGGVAGTVTDTAGAPLPGVKVYLYAIWDRWVASYAATSGTDGTYQISAAWPSSNYAVRFVPVAGSGFAPEWFDDQPTIHTAGRFTISHGTITTDIDASLAAVP
jgi:hypothetical protein